LFIIIFQQVFRTSIMITRELKIIVADDHTLVREGLIKVMEKNQRVTEVKGASDGKEVLALLKTFACDLILMDLDMPVMDGFDTSAEVLKKYPDVKILALSGYSEDKYIYHLIEMGVHGYLPKNATSGELSAAIDDIFSSGFHYNDVMVKAMRRGIIRKSGKPSFRPKTDLTAREKQVLKMICEEKTTHQIAEAIYLGERTVEKVRAALAAKLDVKGTAGLVRYAVQNGLDI